MTTRCIRCGNPIQGMGQFCEQCQPAEQSPYAASASPTTGELPVPCPKCGTPVSGEVNYCPSCGQPIAAMEYAGFWIRFAAWIIDAIIVGVLNFMLDVVVADFALTLVLQIVLGAAYTIGFWVANQGQTPGKAALGIEVVMKDGGAIDVGPAVLRYLGYFPSGVLLGIGYLMIAFTSEKRGLHDYIAGTVVVRR